MDDSLRSILRVGDEVWLLASGITYKAVVSKVFSETEFEVTMDGKEPFRVVKQDVIKKEKWDKRR
jgi:hypothetical protein